MNHAPYHENIKMADLVLADGGLLRVLPYFGIELGFGEKTLAQVCADAGVSVPLVLLVCNLYSFDDYVPDGAELKRIPIEGLVDYLRRSHRDILEVRLPRITESVLTLAEGSSLMDGNLLASFCEKYRMEVVAHFRYEEEVVFPYIRRLSEGERPKYRISEYESHHSDIDAALEDLKNIIVKYLPRTCTIEQCRPVLAELFSFGYDLRKHTELENNILIPLVERIDGGGSGGAHGDYDGVELSGRERQVLAALARGLSNKEIADRLFISAHTVISHRKNIIRKTGIKTAQGLTLYAFINNLVSSEDLR